MIHFTIDPASQQRLNKFLTTLGPRLMAEIHQTLKTVLYQGAQSTVQKYFAGSGSKGGPTTSLLTSRRGALANSLLASTQTPLAPPSPPATTTPTTAQSSSSPPSAPIHHH